MSFRTVILGAGESGTGAAILAKSLGHDVFVSDKGQIKDRYVQELTDASIQFESGAHTETHILNADQVVLSPGIPPSVPLVQQLKRQGIPVISEIEFGALNTDATLIGITGTPCRLSC